MPRGIEQIVNERVIQWQEEQRKSTAPPPPSSRTRQTPVPNPMISISRECGSLGAKVGRFASERLGCGFYSQELVHEIALRAQVERDAVESFDEVARGGFEVMVREIIDGEAFAIRDYRHFLASVIRELSHRASGVVIGRGSQYILDRDLTLRVRTYAPIEKRVQNVIERDGLSAADARGKIRRIDEQRAAFYRQHFGADWSNEADYDLMINTAEIPLEICGDIVAAAFRARFFAE